MVSRQKQCNPDLWLYSPSCNASKNFLWVCCVLLILSGMIGDPSDSFERTDSRRGDDGADMAGVVVLLVQSAGAETVLLGVLGDNV